MSFFRRLLRTPIASWLPRRYQTSYGRVFAVALSGATLGACFDPDDSDSSGDSSTAGTTTATTTIGSTTSLSSTTAASTTSAASSSTSAQPEETNTTEAVESSETTRGDEETSSGGTTQAPPAGTESTSDGADESSTGEPSLCPGGAPTPGEAPYVLRSIVAEQDVNDLDLGDIDGDGHQDLVTLSRIDGAVETFFGDGNGEFTSDGITVIAASGYPDTVRLGAIADDTVDLFVHMEGPVELYVVRGDGAGNWPNPQVYEGTYIRALDLADLNGDDVLDLAYAGATNLEVRLGVRLTETYQDAVEYGENYGSVVRIADVTGDRRLDLLTAEWDATELQVYSGLGDGTFQPEPTVVTSSPVSGIDVGHVDDDEWEDLVLTTADDLRIFYGRANGVSSTPGTVIEDTLGRVQVADVDGDGVQDLVTRSGTAIEIRFADGERSFSAPQSVDCPANVYNLKIADINEDCVPDILAAMGPDQDICVLLSARE